MPIAARAKDKTNINLCNNRRPIITEYYFLTPHPRRPFAFFPPKHTTPLATTTAPGKEPPATTTTTTTTTMLLLASLLLAAAARGQQTGNHPEWERWCGKVYQPQCVGALAPGATSDTRHGAADP